MAKDHAQEGNKSLYAKAKESVFANFEIDLGHLIKKKKKEK